MINLIAMPGTGHNAVMNWLRETTGEEVVNRENLWLADCLEFSGSAVLVLRDFRNWLACRIHRGYKEYIQKDWYERPIIDKWMSHTRAAFCVPTILYPRWVAAGLGVGVDGKQSRFPQIDDDHMSRYEYLEHSTGWQGELYRELIGHRADAVQLSDSIEWVPDHHLGQARLAV